MLAWNLTLAGDYGFLSRILRGTDYLGSDSTAYLESVRKEVDFYYNELNPIMKRCGWPTLSMEHIDGLLGENFRRFLAP